jgi:hypothetical protein
MMNIGWQDRNAAFQRDKPVAHLFIVGEGRDSRRSDKLVFYGSYPLAFWSGGSSSFYTMN